MPKDYKDSPSTHGGPGRVNHPLLLGIIIGLLLGVVISLAVALWLNRLSNPFIQKDKASEPASKISAVQPPPPPEAARKAEKDAAGKVPEKAKSDRPRFEFYQILPGEKEVAPEKPAREKGDTKAPAVAAPKAAAPAPAPPKPGSSPAAPKPHSGDTFWLQAGAFQEEREADNLKARIALTGLEASVKPVTVADRGTLYRVRLGPYQSVDDANRMKAVLAQNGVSAAIIRTTDESKTQ